MGGNVRVARGTAASSDVYLYIMIDGREFFMGHAFSKTRREVKAEALQWLRDHPL